MTITLRAVAPLERVGTGSDKFWHWIDWPRSGGGLDYEREVTVWKLARLPDEGTWLDPEKEGR